MGRDKSGFTDTKHTDRLSKVHKCLCALHQETNEKRLCVCMCPSDGNNKAEKSITTPCNHGNHPPNLPNLE